MFLRQWHRQTDRLIAILDITTGWELNVDLYGFHLPACRNMTFIIDWEVWSKRQILSTFGGFVIVRNNRAYNYYVHLSLLSATFSEVGRATAVKSTSRCRSALRWSASRVAGRSSPFCDTTTSCCWWWWWLCFRWRRWRWGFPLDFTSSWSRRPPVLTLYKCYLASIHQSINQSINQMCI